MSEKESKLEEKSRHSSRKRANESCQLCKSTPNLQKYALSVEKQHVRSISAALANKK